MHTLLPVAAFHSTAIQDNILQGGGWSSIRLCFICVKQWTHFSLVHCSDLQPLDWHPSTWPSMTISVLYPPPWVPVDSTGILWNGRNVQFLWIPMDSQWNSREIPWNSRMISMDSKWNLNGIPMTSKSNQCKNRVQHHIYQRHICMGEIQT